MRQQVTQQRYRLSATHGFTIQSQVKETLLTKKTSICSIKT